MWSAAGPTARRDDALIRRKQPNLTNHVRDLHPAFDRQYDSATSMKELAVSLALCSHMNFLATWQLINRISNDNLRRWHELRYISGPPTVAETQLSVLSAGHKIWNTLPSVRQPIYASQIDPPLNADVKI
jgi:hypothetical protein